MDLYTGKIGVVKNGLDTTMKVKSEPGCLFAPTAQMVLGHKNNREPGRFPEHEPLDDLSYVQKYLPHLRRSFQMHRNGWLDFLNQDHAVILCYCNLGQLCFCHRFMLAAYVFPTLCQALSLPYKYKGEILLNRQVIMPPTDYVIALCEQERAAL